MDSDRTSSGPSAVVEDDESPDISGAAKLMAALTHKQRIVLDALLEGLRPPKAAVRAGVHRGTVNRWLLEDSCFIAAFNARLLEIITLNNARMQTLLPKALQAIEDAIDNGDARLAMQLVKCALQLQQKPLPTSSEVVAGQLKVDAQREQVALQQKQVNVDARRETVLHKAKEVSTARWARTEGEKPSEQSYEEGRRFYYTMMAEAPMKNARREAIDARVRAEVERSVSKIMNPDVASSAAAQSRSSNVPAAAKSNASTSMPPNPGT